MKPNRIFALPLTFNLSPLTFFKGRNKAMKSYGMITKFLVVTLMLMGAVMASQSLYAQCITPPSGMVAWWPLDETSGSIANDMAGSVHNFGTWMNNPTPVSGKVAGALCFDGNDYVEVGNDPEINFGVGDLTIDAWVKRNTASTPSPPSVIVDKRDGSDIGYSLAVSYGRLVFRMSGTNYISATSPVPADGLWHFVAVTVHRATGGGRFYCDGIPLDTFTPLSSSLNNANPLRIGKGYLSGNQPWFGCIDELELFNRALDSLEVRSIWAADSLGKCKDHATFIGHFMTPEGEPYPFDMTISDGEWVQKFDSVTYIETEVPDTATYTYTYRLADAVVRNQLVLCLAEGEVKEIEFLAIPKDSLLVPYTPRVFFRETGANDSLAWHWDPSTHKLSCRTFQDLGQVVDVGWVIDTSLSAPPIDVLDSINLALKVEVDMTTWTATCGGSICGHGWNVMYIWDNGDIWINLHQYCVNVPNPDSGAIGVQQVLQEEHRIPFSISLTDADGIQYKPEYISPQFVIPVDNYILTIDSLPPEYPNQLDLPVNVTEGRTDVFNVYTRRIPEYAPFDLSVLAEFPLANSSYSDLFHDSDSLLVNVGTETNSDWWGSFTLPTYLIVESLFAYSDTLGTEVLTEFHDFTINHIEGSDLFLVVVRNKPYYDRLKIEFALRGDANGSGVIEVGDIIYLINYLYKGGPTPNPPAVADANGDEMVDIGDVIYLINYLYKGGPSPLLCSGKSGGDLSSASRLSDTPGHAQISLVLNQADRTDVNVPALSKASPEAKDKVFSISVVGKSDRDVAGVQLEIGFDPGEVTMLDPALTPLTKDLQLYTSIKDGVQKIGIVDLAGEKYIPKGEGSLVILRAKGVVQGSPQEDLSSIRIKKAILVDKDAMPLALELSGELKQEETKSEMVKVSESKPTSFSLSQNYPNPFNPETDISYALPTECNVKLTIYNVAGQNVRTLVDEHQTTGFKTIHWNGKDNAGKELASGVYFYKIQAGAFTEARKMILMK